MLHGLLVLLVLLLPGLCHAATHLAVGATLEEKTIWQSRAVSGPYKVEWDAIKTRADAFVASPTARWDGIPAGQFYNGTGFGMDRGRDAGLRDAAFVYFVQGGSSYLNAAKTALLAQTTKAGTNFADTGRWPPTGSITGLGNTIGSWLRKMAYAYSYIRPAVTTGERATLDTWFLNAGTYYYKGLDFTASKPSRFPNRLSDVYTPIPDNGGANGPLYVGGPQTYNVQAAWENDPMATNATMAVIGVMLNNATMKNRATRYVQEWLKFNVYPNGEIMDQSRWGWGATTGTPQHGYLYAGQTIGAVLTTADILLRAGYTNLFDYSTSDGMHGTAGGPKTILKAMQHFAKLTNGTIVQIASTDGHDGSEENIDPVGPELTRIEYINLAQGNLYYQDAASITAYTKAIPSAYGTVGCTSVGGAQGGGALGGDWCTLPAVRFMYAGLEGVSMPYGGAAAVEPDYTSNLTMHLKFDEDTLTTAQDSTANNHDGTLSAGASWAPAKMGASAVALDGTATGIVTVTGELGTPAAVTLAAWIKLSAFPTPEAHVLSIGDSVQIAVTSTAVRGWYYTGTSWSNVSATRTLGTTAWHHVAWVVRAGSQQLYLDGLPVASGSNGMPIVYTGLGPNTILGGHGNAVTTNYRFQGTIDDARVYSRALTDVDIAGLANLEDPPPLSVQITTPTPNPSLSVTTSPLPTLGGTASDGTGVTGITWNCPTCSPTSGTAVCNPACGAATEFTNWTVSLISLATGINTITVTATDASGSQTDALAVTYTPPGDGGGGGGTGAACTHYASPTAPAGRSGTSEGQAFRVVDFWAVATPGKVLCMLDGTYTGEVLRVPSGTHGTASQKITIRALNDGKVLINSGDGRAVETAGTSHLVFEGFNVTGGNNAGVRVNGTDNTFRRIVAWISDSTQRPHLWEISGYRNVIEDCAAFGQGEKIIAAGSGGASEGGIKNNYIRRCFAYVMGQLSDGAGGATSGVEQGYGQDGIHYENMLVSWNILGAEGSPQGIARSFRTQNSSVYGYMIYIPATANVGTGGLDRMFAAPTDAGSPPQAPSCNFHPTQNTSYRDIVSFVHPSNPRFGLLRPFRFERSSFGGCPTAPAGSGNTITNILGVGNGPPVISSDSYTLTPGTSFHGSTLSAALSASGHSSIWTLMPGLCKRVVNGAVTTTGLWRWPMNQRILDAMNAATGVAGQAPQDVTATVESLFGTIPSQCLSGSIEEETCTPPLVGTPPNCACPAGTVPPNCDPEIPPDACPPDCPVQDVFVIATTGSPGPAGSDANACTLEAPCATINRARSLMTPGDTLYLRGGTYTGTNNRIATSTGAFPAGNDWNTPTRIAAYAGETVVLQQSSGQLVTFSNPTTDRYVVMDRLILDGATTGGNDTKCLVTSSGVHHIRFQNGTLRNCHFTALDISASNSIEMLNMTIHGTSHAQGASVSGASDSVLFDGVTFHTNAGHGLNASGSGLSNLTVKNSVSRNNTGTGFRLGSTSLLAFNLLVYGNALGVHLTSLAVDSGLYNATVADNSGVEVQVDAGAIGTILTNVLAVGGITDNGTDTAQTTNLVTDPGFVGSGNYHLALDTSPAADAGTCLPGVVDVALDTIPRPQPPGGDCDIGAYERAGDEGEPVLTPGPLSGRPYGSRLLLIP